MVDLANEPHIPPVVERTVWDVVRDVRVVAMVGQSLGVLYLVPLSPGTNYCNDRSIRPECLVGPSTSQTPSTTSP